MLKLPAVLRSLLFTILLVHLGASSFGFTGDKDSLSNTYIKRYPDRFYIKPLLTIRSLELELTHRITDQRVDYKPNGTRYAGLGIFFFDIGLEASLRLPENSQMNPERFGRTRIFDFQANIYTKALGVDVNYQRYKGFFIRNPGEIFESWTGTDNFPQRRDLRLSNTQANIFYIFNHDTFSFRSAYSQADRQLRSKGSLLVFTSITQLSVSADSSLVPSEIRDTFSEAGDFSDGRFTTLAFMPGYAHNFVYKTLYFNLSLAFGTGYQWEDYTLGDNKVEDAQFTMTSNLRSALGYNGDKFFAGASLVFQNVQSTIDDIRVESLTGNIKVFIGYRFKEKGFLKAKLFARK
ncbi:MAG: DUF4421 family protein [Bacteroidota bacterium]